jgi:hypothetical protein
MKKNVKPKDVSCRKCGKVLSVDSTVWTYHAEFVPYCRPCIEEIDRIYKQAKADKNEAQQVKAIIFKSQALQMNEEDSWLKNIKVFEQEIKTAGDPVKQILYSVTAGLYQSYFERQRWKIYDRTVTDNSDPANPDTWSVEDFTQKISHYYEKSLTNPLLLPWKTA